ncbi:MAG: serpin family protein [Candidatus Fermentibacteraceae bacterium]|nr:serpin family protein [Candidatus Fermentibacteraceae bacterium]
MKVLTNLSATAVILLTIVLSCSAEENLSIPEAQTITDTQAVQELISGNNDFAMDLYKEVCRIHVSDNIFLSPYSISSALGMTYAGARGETAAEMAEVLHFTLPVEAINRAFYSLSATLSSGDPIRAESGDPFTLSISNGLWVQDGFNLLDEYVDEITEYYCAAVRNLDFVDDPDHSRETINNWVAENTMDRIQNLIPPGVLNDETRVVLTNAVYFKASWLKPFDERSTSDAQFLLADGSAIEAPMMSQTDHFRFVSTEGCSAVELDYAAGNASMLILLPDGDIEEFQQNFDAGMLESIRRRLSSVRVSLSMPKFEFSRSLQLSQILRTLGLEFALGSGADFSGITGNPDLFISEVLHKAFVKVDEAGTEAAAATAVVMGLTAMPEEPIEMNINRPFLFFILDRDSGSIVFMGRIMDPSV